MNKWSERKCGERKTTDGRRWGKGWVPRVRQERPRKEKGEGGGSCLMVGVREKSIRRKEERE